MNKLREEIEKLSPAERSLFELLLARNGLDASGVIAAVSKDGDELPPLSFAQQRLWFLDQLEPDSAVYNIVSALKIKGALDVQILEKSLQKVVQRQTVLRTTFKAIEGKPRQVVAPHLKLSFPIIDLTSLSQHERQNAAVALAVNQTETPFNLTTGPLLRVLLAQLAGDEYVFVLSIHHIISDGWSMGLLLKEVAACYEAISQGEPPALPELAMQYADFARWQNQWMSGDRLQSHVAYWKRKLGGSLQELKLPSDYPQSARQRHQGGSQSITLSKQLSDRVKAFSQEQGVTLFITLVAAFKALLHGYTGQTDIVISTGIANRTRAETEGLVGFFVNLLILRTNLSGAPTVVELLGRVRETVLEAYAHQDLPYEKLINELHIERQEDGSPLANAVIVLQNAPNEAPHLPGLRVELLNVESRTTRFDLTFFLTETEQGLNATMQYNLGLFRPLTITKMLNRFAALLTSLVAQPQERLSNLNLYTESELKQRSMESKRRKASRFSELIGTKPKVVSMAKEKLVEFGFLGATESTPLVIRPALHGLDLIAWASENRALIEERLRQYGALLFRDFNVESAAQFEQIALSTCTELFEENGELLRTNISGRIYSPVNYPPEKHILWHSENTFCPRWPMKIYFFCMLPAQRGGETPIVDSRKVHAMVRPDIRERFARKNIMYVRNYDGALGLSWQTVFQTDSKQEVEAYCRAHEIEFEWRGENGLRTRTVCPAIARHPKTGEAVWFNQATHWHPSCLTDDLAQSMTSVFDDEEALPRNVYYGDGSPITASEMQNICSVYKQAEICFPWQKGDILLLDNMLVSHARNPYAGPRQIAVAMGDLISKANLPPLN